MIPDATEAWEEGLLLFSSFKAFGFDSAVMI